MKPITMSEIINGKRYSTETSTLLAGDDYWDGHNFERRGRQKFLYRTAKGAYFIQILTQWQGERHKLEPLTQDEALRLWETLSVHRMELNQAFLGVEIEEA